MRVRAFGVVAWAAVISVAISMLVGCGEVERLAVPARNLMLGQVQVNQTYVLRLETTMDVLGSGDVQPAIHLRYDKKEKPPAEAFERVPFPVDATVSISSSDPTASATASAYYVPVKIPAGTEMAVSAVEIYANSRVYRGRILTGPQANCHILLVVPGVAAQSPTTGELQAQDEDYLVPVAFQGSGGAGKG